MNKIENVQIMRAERLNCSVNGNPRWRITLDNYDSYETSSDAACNYEVSNYLNSGERVSLELTRAGKVSVIRGTR